MPTPLETYLIIALGGALGSCVRYALGLAIQERTGPGFPWGTLAINVTGSFVIGLFITAADRHGLDARWRLLVAVGFCGGYTTFSTFALETVKLLGERAFGLAGLYVVGSSLAGILAIVAGATLARRL